MNKTHGKIKKTQVKIEKTQQNDFLPNFTQNFFWSSILVLQMVIALFGINWIQRAFEFYQLESNKCWKKLIQKGLSKVDLSKSDYEWHLHGYDKLKTFGFAILAKLMKSSDKFCSSKR